MKLRLRALILATICILLLTAGCSSETKLSHVDKQPTNIEIWHYYNGAQKQAFDKMLDDFNATVGHNQGIIVVGHNYGDVNQLEQSVMASINKEVGSEPAPDIFASYADTAYAIEQMGLLANLDKYFTAEEQAQYVPSYIEEGRLGSNGELIIFPIAKSTEVFMLNKTDWDPFAADTGKSLEDLATNEGLVAVARAYYEWSDAKTPDILDDGHSFYGRDALANLFVIGSKQLGTELFEVENGQVQLHISEPLLRRMWENYYLPHINSYFAANGRFRSEDVKLGDLIALTGSSSAATFFPKEVTHGEITYPIETIVLPAPHWKGGAPYAVQQGAGMVVTKSDMQSEAAAVMFLKWFTEVDRNLEFCSTSGYMPVKKEANNIDLLLQKLEQSGKDITPIMRDTIRVSFETVNTTPLYTSKAFDNGSAARQVLTFHLADKIEKDLAKLDQKQINGLSRADAIKELSTEKAFQAWSADFEAALRASLID